MEKQHHERIIFETILNFIGYLMIFILFSWDKLYYILIKKGNDIDVYFKFSKNNNTIKKEEFINLYKFNSLIKKKSAVYSDNI